MREKQTDGKKRAREILSSLDALHYMSSSESCEDEAVEPVSGPKPRKIRKLSWEAPVPFFFSPSSSFPDKAAIEKVSKGNNINDWDRRESCQSTTEKSNHC